MNATSEDINQKIYSLRDLLMSLKKHFIEWGIGDFWSGVLINLVGAAVLFIICWISYVLAKKVMLRALRFLLDKTDNHWGNVLLENKVFSRLTNIVPALTVHVLVPVVFDKLESLVVFVQGASKIYLVLVLLFTLQAFFASVLDVYQRFDISKRIPIKGLTQALMLIACFVGGVFIISIIIGREIGALMAV